MSEYEIPFFNSADPDVRLFPRLCGENIAVTLYGDDSYPPYSFLNKGKIEGIYPHIMQQVAERIEGYDIKITLLPWKRALRLAKKGQIFAVFPPYYLPDRRPYFSEYSVPILPEETIAYCAKSILIPRVPAGPRLLRPDNRQQPRL